MRCNICGSERAIGSGGSSVPNEIICPDCGTIQTLSKETPFVAELPKTIKNFFTLKDLFIWYQAVGLEIFNMETKIPKTMQEACLQYNPKREKQRLEKVKASKEYKDLVELKEKLENIKIEISFDKVENDI